MHRAKRWTLLLGAACLGMGGLGGAIAAPACAHEVPASIATLDQAEIYATMQALADWQLQYYDQDRRAFTNYAQRPHMAWQDHSSDRLGWVYAAFHMGFARWAFLAEDQGDASYANWLKQTAARNKYLVSQRIYNADDYAIGQLYLDLYQRYEDPAALAPLKVIFEIILSAPSTVDLHYERVEQPSSHYEGRMIHEFAGREADLVPCKERWCWADALFMGPPVWVHLAQVTGDQRYLDFADSEFWATADLLWDEEDHLFFRDSRFYDRREANGEKVIWARGVGWVAAGLARILEHLPQDHARRADYEDLFRKMMTRLAGAQQADGLWRPSVLDPQSKPFKETSGTALMAFAYASGIRQGVLDREQFEPTLLSAWAALNDAIQPDGKLGWVQQIGEKPENVSRDESQLYAVGAFLALGSELHAMAKEAGK